MDHGDGRREKACIKPGKVNVREIVGKLEGEVRPRDEIAMPDDYSRLECDICGIPIENPFLLLSSVVASTYDMRVFSMD